jgi:hypothetical protein
VVHAVFCVPSEFDTAFICCMGAESSIRFGVEDGSHINCSMVPPASVDANSE